MNAFVWSFEHSLALPFYEIGMKTKLSSPGATAEFSKFAGRLSAALSWLTTHFSYIIFKVIFFVIVKQIVGAFYI